MKIVSVLYKHYWQVITGVGPDEGHAQTDINNESKSTSSFISVSALHWHSRITPKGATLKAESIGLNVLAKFLVL